MMAEEQGDYATALSLWRRLADQGNPRAQGKLGGMYYNGHGVAQDYAEAVKWFRLAADPNNTKSTKETRRARSEQPFVIIVCVCVLRESS